MWLIGAMTAAIACVTTWLVTPSIVRIARRVGAVDHPGPRKIHASPIPRVGGIAVFLGFVAGLMFAAFATGYAANTQLDRAGYWTILAIAAAAVLIVGLVDDIRPVSYQWKFRISNRCGDGRLVCRISHRSPRRPVRLRPVSISGGGR